MKRQDALDHVTVQLILQGEKCLGPSGRRCAYRSGKKRCAIGWLIPDSAYSEHFEGYALAGLIRHSETRKKLPYFLKTKKNVDFYSDLQNRLHDSIAVGKPENWPAVIASRAHEFAQLWNLRTPPAAKAILEQREDAQA